MRDSDVSDALSSLVGIWRDENGSRYELELERLGKSLNVTTIRQVLLASSGSGQCSRPDGGVRTTKGLIRMEKSRNDEEIVWGQSSGLSGRS